MGDGRLCVIAIADRVRRAGHRLCDTERPAGTADECRLAGTKLAVDGDDVTGLEMLGKPRPYGFGLLRRLGD